MAKKQGSKYEATDKLLGASIKKSGELELSEDSRLKVESAILDRTVKTNAQLDAMIAKHAKIDAIQRKTDNEAAKRAGTYAAIQKKVAKEQEIGHDFVKALNKSKTDAIGFDKAAQDLAKEGLKAARKQVHISRANGDITGDHAIDLRAMLEIREKEITALGIAAGKAQSYNDTLQGVFSEGQAASDEFFNSFPGGSQLKSLLGVDKVFEEVGKAGAKAINDSTAAMVGSKGPQAAMIAGQAAFNVVAMMNPYVLIAAAILIVIGLIFQQNAAIRKQAEAQGVSLAAAKQQVIAAKEQVGQGKTILANTEDVLTAQNAVNDALGTTIAMNAENAAQVADVGKAMGYGAKVAGESAAAMMKMGASQQEVADLQMETNLMSVKAGVDMGKVQADIAKNAGTVAKYFAGNPKALAKAAVEAQKIGVSLSTMAKVSDGLLDFEKSISAQFELQAMTGKQMNFDKARQLALEGDILGATQAVMGQIGDIHDFNKMDVLERKKLAQATGMDVEELQKALTIQSMRGDMTDEELAKAQGLNLSAAELNDLTAEDLKKKLASQDATAKMAAVMAQLKEQVMLTLQPIMDIVSTLMNVLSPIMKIGAMINNLFMMPLKAVLGLVQGLFNAIMGAIQPLLDIFDELGGMLGGGGGITDMFVGIGEVIGNFILKPVKMLANMIKAVLMPIIGAVKNVFSSVGEVVDTITSAFGGGGGGGGMMDIISKIGSMIGTVLALPLKAIGFLISNVLVPAIEMILLPFQMIWDIVKMIGDAIYSYLIAPIESALDMLAKLNPMNWFSSDDEAPEAVVEAMAKGGTSKGGLTLVGEEGPELITLPGGAQVSPAGETDSLLSSVTDLAKKAFSFTPMGMAAGALGSLFGGSSDTPNVEPGGGGSTAANVEPGGGGIMGLAKDVGSMMLNPLDTIGGLFGGDDAPPKTDQQLLDKLDQVIMAIQNMEINMDGEKVGNMTRLADTFRRG